MAEQALFWLHIKKSAGTSIRALLAPHYLQVDRSKWPENFTQASPREYNDILNNYRVVLGEYQFKRSLFAKKYLYPDTWDQLFSFAFSREPSQRCVSMFHYLFWRNSGIPGRLRQSFRKYINNKKVILRSSYAFDVFLDYVHEAHTIDSISKPLGLHFSTHTAPMWGDITDEKGNVLLKQIYRLDRLDDGINSVFEECGVTTRIKNDNIKLKQNNSRKIYVPNQAQRAKIENIYSKDFELYETSGS